MTMRLQTPRSSRTNTSSRRVKPWLSFPTGDITVIPFASWDAVGSIGNNIIGPMIARALVHVRLTPGILGQLFLYVRPVPAIESGRLLSQRLETFFRRRSEEHTSELQSPDHLVCRLLLEKKKQKRYSR